MCDIIAVIVVALTLIPEAIDFSIVAGSVHGWPFCPCCDRDRCRVHWCGPGMPGLHRSRCRGCHPLLRDHEAGHPFAATIFMGLVQIIVELLRLDRLMQAMGGSMIANPDIE